MRYKRLQHLLEKSNIYSKFLLTKMEQQQLEVSVFLSAVEILKMCCHLVVFWWFVVLVLEFFLSSNCLK